MSRLRSLSLQFRAHIREGQGQEGDAGKVWEGKDHGQHLAHSPLRPELGPTKSTARRPLLLCPQGLQG